MRVLTRYLRHRISLPCATPHCQLRPLVEANIATNLRADPRAKPGASESRRRIGEDDGGGAGHGGGGGDGGGGGSYCGSVAKGGRSARGGSLGVCRFVAYRWGEELEAEGRGNQRSGDGGPPLPPETSPPASPLPSPPQPLALAALTHPLGPRLPFGTILCADCLYEEACLAPLAALLAGPHIAGPHFVGPHIAGPQDRKAQPRGPLRGSPGPQRSSGSPGSGAGSGDGFGDGSEATVLVIAYKRRVDQRER